jgi:hypothetical protein
VSTDGEQPTPGEAREIVVEAGTPASEPVADARPTTVDSRETPIRPPAPDQGDVVVHRAPKPPLRARVVAAGSVAGSSLRAWSRRPSGRLVVPGLLIALLLVFGGAAGAYVAPHLVKGAATTPPAPPPEPTNPSEDAPGTSDPNGPSDEPTSDPVPGTSLIAEPSANTGGNPADVLARWAIPLSEKLGIPAVALQAYGYAQLYLEREHPGCRLSWTTLAGIGKIESNHGRADGARLNPNGQSEPTIIGPPLDGQSGRQSIPDTDGGLIDTDRSWDRAVGPMQFIPSTWKQYAVDANHDGQADINNIDDAALAAGELLCSGGRDLSTGAGWNAAVSAYNAVGVYIQDVFNATNDYGRRSRL